MKVLLVDWSVNNLSGGEILVPKIASTVNGSYKLLQEIKFQNTWFEKR